MTAPQLGRPAQPLHLPDRRSSRPHQAIGNRDPWHPVTNPHGLASGTVIYGPVTR